MIYCRQTQNFFEYFEILDSVDSYACRNDGVGLIEEHKMIIYKSYFINDIDDDREMSEYWSEYLNYNINENKKVNNDIL